MTAERPLLVDTPLTAEKPVRKDNPIYHFAVWVSATLSGDRGLARMEQDRLAEFGISVSTNDGELS